MPLLFLLTFTFALTFGCSETFFCGVWNQPGRLIQKNTESDRNLKGDGVTDDYPALMRYIRERQAAGKPILLPPATYYISKPLNLSGNLVFASTRPGKTATLLFPKGSPDQEAIKAYNPPVAHQSSLGVSAKAGTRTISLTNVIGLAPGMLIKLNSSRTWELDENKAGELQVIQSISGNRVSLLYQLQDSYDIPAETVRVTAYHPVSFNMRDVAICRQEGGNCNINLSLWHYLNSEIRNFTIKSGQKSGIVLYACYNTKVHHGTISGANLGREGYGIVAYGGMFFDIYAVLVQNSRKLIDFSSWGAESGIARHGRVHNNTVIGEGVNERGQDLFEQGQSVGIGSHGGSEHIVIDHNTILNCYVGIQLRGRNMTVRENQVRGKSWVPFWSYGGYNHNWEANNYQTRPPKVDLREKPSVLNLRNTPAAIFYLDPLMTKKGYVRITGNTGEFSRVYGVIGEQTGNTLMVLNNEFRFVTFTPSDRCTGVRLVKPQRGAQVRVRDNRYWVKGPGKLAAKIQY